MRFLCAKFGLMLVIILSSVGCTNEFADISDNNLADSMHECRTTVDQSPGFAIRCDNVVRECKRRRDAGRYVC